MNNLTVNATETLETMQCGTCGLWYAAPDWWWKEQQKNGGDIHCPRGCRRTYGPLKKRREDKLQERLDAAGVQLAESRSRERTARASAASADRRTSAQKGVVTKIRKRIAGGACPCCNRSFVDLGRHMKSKHPDYAEAES